MSALDAASLLIGLPTYVETFVKTCRAIKDYKDLDENFKTLFDRAILNSERLLNLTSQLDGTASCAAETQNYIQRVVLQSKICMERTRNIANDWKARLEISDEEEVRSKTSTHSGPSKSSRLRRLVPTLSSCFGKNSADSTEGNTYFRARFAEAEYLIIGKLELTAAMENFEHYLDNLQDGILSIEIRHLSTSMMPRKGTPESIKFVNLANERTRSNSPINSIDGRLLLSLSDIDPAMPTGIHIVDSGPYSGCIVDPRDVWYYTGKKHIAWDETRNIARLLAEDEKDSDRRLCAEVGILPSCGYSELDKDIHAIVFRLPPGICHPCTLRRRLVEGNVKHALHDRVGFAIKLATSVLVVHSLGLVHKSIRPDSIIITEGAFGDARSQYPYQLGTPYLLAFDSSRDTKGPTMKHPLSVPEGFLWQSLYRHPRHFPDRKYKYEMRDDIYSLGVCLFEVALWKSLFRWNESGGEFEENVEVLDLSSRRCNEEATRLGKSNIRNMMWFRRFMLIESAKEMIPPIMGTIFRDVVVACLSFGESSDISRDEAFEPRFVVNSNLSPEDQSIHFVRDVLSKLRSIKLS